MNKENNNNKWIYRNEQKKNNFMGCIITSQTQKQLREKHIYLSKVQVILDAFLLRYTLFNMLVRNVL